MNAFRKFDPRAFEAAEERDSGAKAAKAAKAGETGDCFSDFSGLSRGAGQIPAAASEAFAPPETVPEACRQPAEAALPGEGPTVEDWRAFFDERAGIAEHDGGMSRSAAEAQALECCIVEWLDRHPEPSFAGRCAWCAGAETAGSVVVPYGTQAHTWLHSECWAPWYQKRRRHAVAALTAMGIEERSIDS